MATHGAAFLTAVGERAAEKPAAPSQELSEDAQKLLAKARAVFADPSASKEEVAAAVAALNAANKK